MSLGVTTPPTAARLSSGPRPQAQFFDRFRELDAPQMRDALDLLGDAEPAGGRARVRSIIMTAIARILALMPPAAGLGQGSIIAAELGTVVIGGPVSSTC